MKCIKMHPLKLVLSAPYLYVISLSLWLVPCTVPVMRLSPRFWLVSFIHSFFLPFCLSFGLSLFVHAFFMSLFFASFSVFLVFSGFSFLAFYRYFALSAVPICLLFYVQFVCLSFCLSFIFSIFLFHLEHANWEKEIKI